MSGEEATKGVESVEQSDIVGDENPASRNVENPVIRREVLQMIEGTEEKKRKDGKPIGVKRNEKRITPKMRVFASLIAQGNSPRESYRKAYDVGVGTSEATVIAGANKLMKDSRIGALVEPVFEAVKQTIIDDAIATKRFVLEELHSHATSEENRASDRIKALELMGKSIGLFLDKSEAKAEKVDAEKLKKELDVHLKTFKLRAV